MLIVRRADIDARAARSALARRISTPRSGEDVSPVVARDRSRQPVADQASSEQVRYVGPVGVEPTTERL